MDTVKLTPRLLELLEDYKIVEKQIADTYGNKRLADRLEAEDRRMILVELLRKKGQLVAAHLSSQIEFEKRDKEIEL